MYKLLSYNIVFVFATCFRQLIKFQWKKLRSFNRVPISSKAYAHLLISSSGWIHLQNKQEISLSLSSLSVSEDILYR